MKSIITRFLRVILAIIFAATLFTSSAQAAPQKFEYKVVHFAIVTEGGANLDEQRAAELQTTLDKLGAEGWELVIFAGGGLAIFKRAL